MQSYTHTCSCGEKYTDNDPEVYFCLACVKMRKAVALEVDKKMAQRPKKVQMSNYQILQAKGQSKGEATFVKARDLGINFS